MSWFLFFYMKPGCRTLTAMKAGCLNQVSHVPLMLSCRKLYVSLAVVICLLMSCLIIFFLFPRSINVQPAGLNASSIAFDAAISSIILNMTVSSQAGAYSEVKLSYGGVGGQQSLIFISP